MNQTQIPLTSLLVKPSGPDCNLSCEYCFYLSKSELFPDTKHHRMKDSILKETIRQALAQCDQSISISWQGGEPTLLGLDFFKRAVDYQKQFGHGKTVSNAFQTNGVLLNRKWAEFFKKYNFLIGLSLDGPQHIHDRYRRFPKSMGSWEKVLTNAIRLVKIGNSVNVMTCLTDYSVQFPEEIYQFHKGVGLIYMQFIPIVEWERKEDGKVASYSVTAEQYGDFLCRLFDQWLTDFRGEQPTTSVRLFESMFFTCLGQVNPQCTFRKQCGQYMVVEHNGDVYSCDFFVEPQWRLGNVMRGRLDAMLNSRKQHEFKQRKKAPEACSSCSYKVFCQGGCPNDRFFNGDSIDENYFCAAYKKLFEHALPTLKKLAARWQPNAETQS